jgi:hypothetical protein
MSWVSHRRLIIPRSSEVNGTSTWRPRSNGQVPPTDNPLHAENSIAQLGLLTSLSQILSHAEDVARASAPHARHNTAPRDSPRCNTLTGRCGERPKFSSKTTTTYLGPASSVFHATTTAISRPRLPILKPTSQYVFPPASRRRRRSQRQHYDSNG